MFSHSNNISVVSIEGNIGSGKSTLLNSLKRFYSENTKIIFLNEPVSEWETIQSKDGENMIEKFYADQEKYSFSFQMMAYISRLAAIKEAFENNRDIIIITERSLYTDKFVFAQMLYDDGKIEDVNFQIYAKWFDTFAKDYPIDKVVYVKTDPQVCFDRIGKRSRDGESNIPLVYLKNCDIYHDTLVSQFSKVLELNGNQDIYKNTRQLDDWLIQLDTYIHNK